MQEDFVEIGVGLAACVGTLRICTRGTSAAQSQRIFFLFGIKQLYVAARVRVLEYKQRAALKDSLG